MKKVLAFILSLVLVFTLVAVVACDFNGNAGGNNFKEVDLTDTAKREEFVNALAERADVDKLFGDTEKDGWKFGVEEKASTKLAFDLDMTPEGAEDKFTAKGNVELKESVKASIKSNGSAAAPDFAASISLGLKGNADLSDAVYSFINEQTSETVGALIKKLSANFNYSVNGYVDNTVALLEVSDSLYDNLPEDIQAMLGSKKIKLPFASLGGAATFAAEEGDSDFGAEATKEYIDSVIVEYLLQFKITVAVSSNSSGFALRLTANKDSVLAVVDGLVASYDEEEAAAIKEMVSSAITEAKFVLTVRVDKNGGFASIKEETSLKLDLDVAIPDFVTAKGTLSWSVDVEVSKFNGTVKKPNDASYQLPAYLGDGE